MYAPVVSPPRTPAVREARFANGLKVLMSERSVPMVRVTAVVLRDWSRRNTVRDGMFTQVGVASRSRPREAVVELLDSLGGTMSRNVQPDRLELSVAVRPTAVGAVLALLHDLLAEP